MNVTGKKVAVKSASEIIEVKSLFVAVTMALLALAIPAFVSPSQILTSLSLCEMIALTALRWFCACFCRDWTW